MDLRFKILDWLAYGVLAFAIILLLTALFGVGIAFFSWAGFALVFSAGLGLGFFLASRLLLLVFKN